MREALNKRTVTPDEAVQMFGVPKGTLANLRSQKRGCRYFKQGKRVFYRTDEFEKWLTSNPVMTTDSIEG